MSLYLDTNVVIYIVERNVVFYVNARNRLATAQAAGGTLMISDLTRMESLVGPLKSGDARVEADYHAFFAITSVVAITSGVCDRAARIRASYKFKPMDALQLAAAVEHGATTFLTADARLSAFTGITVEILK